MKPVARITALVLLVCALFSFTACNNKEERAHFDYTTAPLSDYVSFDGVDWRSLPFSVEKTDPVTDEDVTKKINALLGSYKIPMPDQSKPLAEGDLLYLSYTGITLEALNAAVAEGKIPDVDCTGLTYSQIVSMQLGFTGGTTQQMTGITLGKAGYIDGFESGLYGLVVGEHGAEHPYPLHVTFPVSYGNTALAGAPVVFFCALGYIGNGESNNTFSEKNINAAYVNRILGLEGAARFSDMDEYRAAVRDTLESTARDKMTTAMINALVEKATFLSIPEDAINAYIDDYIENCMAEMQYYYETSRQTYYQYFKTYDAPTRELAIQALGLDAKTYREDLRANVTVAVKQKLVLWYLVRQENITLTDEEIARQRGRYAALNTGNTVADADLESFTNWMKEQKFIRAELERKQAAGQLTFTEPTGK